MDALKMIRLMRDSGIEPTIIDIGIDRADFRLGVKFKDPYDLYHAGGCLKACNKHIVFGDDFFYFDTLIVDDKVFEEIVVGG
jgi:hypothetical protein